MLKEQPKKKNTYELANKSMKGYHTYSFKTQATVQLYYLSNFKHVNI